MKTNSSLFAFVAILFSCIYSGCRSDANHVYYDIIPPFSSSLQIPEATVIDPANDQVVHFKNGISVEVPANAFVDKNGAPVTKPVTLSVSAYDTKSKILASGLPMKYTEDGKEHDFESAGMFKIEGFAEGNKVEIGKDKKLAVNFPSKAVGDFDFYFLDEREKPAVKTAGFAGSPATEGTKQQGTWKKLSPTAKINDYDTSKTIKNFKLKFSVTDYPQLAELNSINWHLATTYHDPTAKANEWVLNKEWTSLEVSKPKYITGEPTRIFSPHVARTKRFNHDEVEFSPDHQYAVIVPDEQKLVMIWSVKKKRAITIDNVIVVEHEGPSIHCFDNYFLVDKENGMCAYSYEGQVLATYGHSATHQFSKNKQRVVYYYSERKGFEFPSIRLADFKGNVIKEFDGYDDDPDPNSLGYAHNTFFITDDDKLVIGSSSMVAIYDLSGNLIKKQNGKFTSVDNMENGKLLCCEQNGRLMVWDYKSGYLIESKSGDFDLSKNSLKGFKLAVPVPHSNFIVLNDVGYYYKFYSDHAKPSKIWNYKTNETFSLNFSAVIVSGSNHIVTGNDSMGKLFIYDLDKRKELAVIENFGSFGDAIPYASIGNKILLESNSHSLLYDLNGKLIKDFKKFDSSITNIHFADSSHIYTYSGNGTYRLWDMNGKLLLTKVIDDQNDSYSIVEGQIVFVNDELSSYKIIDLNGNLLLNGGQHLWHNVYFKKVGDLVSFTKSGVCDIMPCLDRPELAYQLTLRNKEDEFQAYIYLDKATKEKIDRFNAFRKMKIDEEQKRMTQEDALVRRFEIDKFGVYNWDKLMTDENRITFAATFKFDVPVDYNNITIFCVTKIDGNAVIKFQEYSWKTFYIDPTKNNKLIAVLPGNKIAVFSDEEMKKINWEKVKQDHVLTINMKTVEHPIDSLSSLDQFL